MNAPTGDRAVLNRPHRSQMPEANRLRIVQVNAVYDAAARTAPQLLDAYPTLCEWSDTLLAAGAVVATVQRFHKASLETRGDAHHMFVRDSHIGTPRADRVADRQRCSPPGKEGWTGLRQRPPVPRACPRPSNLGGAAAAMP